MQTYTLEIQDDVLPQVLAILQNTFTKSVKIKPQPKTPRLEKVEQKSDVDLNQHLNNYSSVSSDKTDENWLNNVFFLMDKSFNESELAGQTITERDWTRDEIYER